MQNALEALLIRRITATGPLTLAARYAGRAPSKSRIDVTVSGYTSMAA